MGGTTATSSENLPSFERLAFSDKGRTSGRSSAQESLNAGGPACPTAGSRRSGARAFEGTEEAVSTAGPDAAAAASSLARGVAITVSTPVRVGVVFLWPRGRRRRRGALGDTAGSGRGEDGASVVGSRMAVAVRQRPSAARKSRAACWQGRARPAAACTASVAPRVASSAARIPGAFTAIGIRSTAAKPASGDLSQNG